MWKEWARSGAMAASSMARGIWESWKGLLNPVKVAAGSVEVSRDHGELWVWNVKQTWQEVRSMKLEMKWIPKRSSQPCQNSFWLVGAQTVQFVNVLTISLLASDRKDVQFAMITKCYCWNLILEKVSNKFLLSIFALDFYLRFCFEWELAEKNKTSLGFRRPGSGSAAKRTAIVGNFQTKKEQIWFFFFFGFFSRGHQDVHIWLNCWCWASSFVSRPVENKRPYHLGMTIDHFKYRFLHKQQNSH